MKRSSRLIFAALTALFFVLLVPAIHAHPMGNFSISHYSGIHISDGSIEIRYIIDMAEIPTYQELQSANIVAQEGDPSLNPYLKNEAALLARGLLLEIDHHAVPLTPVSQSILFPPGAGGLPTMKMGFVYRAHFTSSTSGKAVALLYRDSNFAGHTGWKEIVVSTGAGATLPGGNTHSIDRSAQLSNYPTDLINSPPQDLETNFEFNIAAAALPRIPERTQSATPAVQPVKPALGSLHSNTQKPLPVPTITVPADQELSAAPTALQLRPNVQSTPRSRFTELISNRSLSFGFLFTAALLAMGLGALHALEPGHGKTIVAAYLVGSRGNTRHAVGLGLLVTASHTAGVYLLGAITLYASRYIVPEQLYPWLGLISGLIITALAAYLFLRALTGQSGDHDDASGKPHSHWFSSLTNNRNAAGTSAGNSTSTESGKISLRQLLLLGITGGIIPCPAALVVLLSALSLHRVGFGLFLIVAFSAGLALVLIGIGLLMVSAKRLVSRWRPESPWITRYLPLISSGFMFCLGLGIAIRALMTTGISLSLRSNDHVGSFVAIVLLGLFLGMRHSTDPDHVVAVSTIVSRERSIRQGALIGMMWGVGHTLTIFLVGAAIILFGLVIPPRIGLSMEFAVALMLILLGILNLTGTLSRITARLTPAQTPQADALVSNGSDSQSTFVRWVSKFGYYQLLRPLFIGLVHGLAGSAAVALLVLSMIHNPMWAIAYLLVFGGGTVIGMMIMTTALAVPIAWSGNRFSRATGYLSFVSGVISMAFGVFLVYQIGFVDGLFTAHVHWTPQ